MTILRLFAALASLKNGRKVFVLDAKGKAVEADSRKVYNSGDVLIVRRSEACLKTPA